MGKIVNRIKKAYEGVPITFLDKIYAKQNNTWEILAQEIVRDEGSVGITCKAGEPDVSLVKGFIDPSKKISVKWKNGYKKLGDMGLIGMASKAVSAFWNQGKTIRIAKDVSGIGEMLEKASQRDDVLGWAADAMNTAIDRPLGFLDGTDFAKHLLPTDENGNVDMSTGDALINGLESVPYFSGASCEIGIPELKLRYFHKMDGTTTCRELVYRLNERFMGKTKDMIKFADRNAEHPTAESKANGVSKGAIFSLVAPPNGFVTGRAGNINYNGYLRGAFELRYGRLKLPNLICENVSYDFSQQRVMVYNDDGFPVVTDDYLFVDISIKLKPAVLYTSETIANIIDHNSTIKKLGDE